MSELPSSGVSPEARQTLQQIIDGFYLASKRLAAKTGNRSLDAHRNGQRETYFHCAKAVESWLTPLPPAPQTDDAHALSEAKAILLGIGDIGYAMTHPDGAHTALGQAAAALHDECNRRASAPLPPAAPPARPETGPMQIGDDWPGVFIRGDNALAWAFMLHHLLDNGQPDPIAIVNLRGLARTLGSCDVRVAPPAAGLPPPRPQPEPDEHDKRVSRE